MEVAPAWDTKKVVYHNGSGTLTREALIACQLFSGFLGVISSS
jgi:hypothetical protein